MNTPDQVKHIEYQVPIPADDGREVSQLVKISVPVAWDEDIQDYVLTAEAIRLIEDTQARHMGLLSPAELKSMRERLGLTQAEIGDILQIGEKSWTRWETGKQRPSRSTNLFLRCIKEGVLSPYLLDAMRNQPAGWSPLSFHDNRTYLIPPPSKVGALVARTTHAVTTSHASWEEPWQQCA